MNMDMRIFESLRRQQLVTEYIIYPFSDIENYQVLLTGVPSSSKEDVLVVSNKKILPHWVESKGSVWTKIPKLVKNTPVKIYTLTGNPSAASASNGANTFVFFDDFNTYDTSKWGSSGTPTVSNSIISIGSGLFFYSLSSFNINYAITWNASMVSTSYGVIGFGLSDNTKRTAFYANFQVANQHNAYNKNVGDSYAGMGAQTGYKKLTVKRNNTINALYSINYGSDTSLSTDLSTVDFKAFIYAQSQIITADWVYIRKYASPEPIIQKIRTSNKSLLLKELMR